MAFEPYDTFRYICGISISPANDVNPRVLLSLPEGAVSASAPPVEGWLLL
jgi:hypothetical protein